MPNQPWHHKAIIYELYVDKFAGNFQGLISRLPYLKDLEINTLWLLPHYPSPMVDGGYDISDYYSIRSDLGNMDEFETFLGKAHEMGLKVILDLVLNHTSIEHPWFKEHKYWYIRSHNIDQYSQAFVHFSKLKNGKNWIPDPENGDYYYASFYPTQADLNWDNPEVEAEMFKVADFWLDKGVDGFRLDAVSRLIKREHTSCFALPETHEILKRLRAHIDLKYQKRILIAETGGWPEEARPFFSSCHIVLHFPLAMRLLTGIPYKETSKFSQVLNWSGQIPDSCRWGAFLTNHDSVDVFFLNDDGEKRWFLDTVDPGRRFINSEGTSIGARLAEICQGDPGKIFWATQQLLSFPAVPIIYYGNEIGMRNLDLKIKPLDVREFVRGPFDWDSAKKQQSDPNSLFHSVRRLLNDRSKI